MRQVCMWIEEYALAAMGVTDGDARATAGRLSEAQLEDKIAPLATLVDKPTFMQRVTALREIGTNWRAMTPDQLSEAMTTAHFTAYFSDALSRAFYADYSYEASGWQQFIYNDTAPDFRDVSRFRMSEPGTLYRRRQKAEAKTTSIAETEITYGVEEYARQFDVSWQTLLNDDLGKIKETPTRMASAARRWLDQFVNALYDNATTQAALIAAGALYGGTGRLTAANLAIGLNAMMQRTDALGNLMAINKVWLVIPKVLEIQAATILEDVLSIGGAGSNVLGRFVGGVIIDPYITFVSPNVPWYLIADPSEVPTITLVRMAGWPGPVVMQKNSDIRFITGSAPAPFRMGSFATGDIEYMVEDVVGAWDDATWVGVTDFRGIYYSSGTTP